MFNCDLFSYLFSDVNRGAGPQACVEAKCGVEFRNSPPEFGGKWEVEYFNTRLPLSILVQAGYSVNIKKYISIRISYKICKYIVGNSVLAIDVWGHRDGIIFH